MPDFCLRAIEVHSSYAWDARWIEKVLDFAARNRLNALVLHRNDIVDQVVFPGIAFGVPGGAAHTIFERYNAAFRSIYRYTPTRRSGPLLRRDYLRWVVEEAGRAGIGVYLENKELSFPDALLELHPQLVKDGHACPTDPFWWDYLRAKYTELLEDVPGIAGIITSAGTGESRVSISANRCTCATCRATTPQQWYGRLLGVLHGVLSPAGKRFAVRDFAFDRKSHADLAAGFEALPADVALAIKNTPHDYYPTFPDNPLTSAVPGREKWIEFDAMGQYFGWGIGPATMLEDLRTRMGRAAAAGASGIILRTDWESLDGHTAFDTPNILNLYAGAALACDLSTPDSAIYERWLTDAGAWHAGAGAGSRQAAIERISAIFARNWEVVRQALFAQDCVFSDCSTFPVGYEQAAWLAEEKNSLKDWAPDRADALAATAEAALRILAEKDAALDLVRELGRRCDDLGGCGLSREFVADLKRRYLVFERYVRGFRAVARLFVLVRLRRAGWSADAPLGGRPLAALFADAGAEVDAVIGIYEDGGRQSGRPPAEAQLLSADRLRCFRGDAIREWEA